MPNSNNFRKERDVADYQKRIFGDRYVGAHVSKILGLDEQTQRALLQFLEKPKNFLVYCGNPGIGKTYLCAALAEWYHKTFDTFRYWNEHQLLKRLRDVISEGKGDYLDALQFAIDDQFLMFDDMGSQGHNEWREEIHFALIDQRYNSELPTLITTNYSREDIKKIYHPRLYSRLFAKENTIIEIIDGTDLRISE